MPRRYIYRDEKDKWNLNAKADDAYNGGEATVLANTDFDAIYNPIPAFNFVMEVEGLYFLPIKTVRAFTKENEFEYIREGGVNDYIHLKRKPISKPFTFQIERYIGTERFLDPLALGTELILPLVLYVYRHKARAGLTASAPAWPARVYTFMGCTVMSKEYGELNAEKSGLLTETTTIAYRELGVINNGIQSISEQEEWNPENYKDKDGPGYINRYAAFSPNDDKAASTYWYEWKPDKEGILHMQMKDKAAYKFKSSFDPEDKTTHRGKLSLIDQDEKNKPYEVEEVDGKPTLVRNKKHDLTRPQYELNKDKSTPKYAATAFIDKNANTPIYKEVKGEDGLKHLKRDDQAKINKEPWDGTGNNVKTKWAKQAANDKNSVYDVTTTDGVRTVKRKESDTSDFNAGAYSMKRDKTKKLRGQLATNSSDKAVVREAYKIENGATAKHATQSSIDKAGKTYTVTTEDGVKTVKRTDSEKINKPAYSYATDKATTKYAQTSPRDGEKAVVRDPYSIKDGATAKHAQSPANNSDKAVARNPYSIKDGAKVKHAVESPTDADSAEARNPYSISEGAKAKYAVTSPKDSEKAQARLPYGISEGPKAKYAVTSPKDSEKAPPVTWPPTRRALMADNLKK
ncbi:MAG: hypothetical protein K6C96_04110 [Butyrivibrio sp.]|nr:hypothetical protein [Butyrivibrio sp.]